jgi:hypothetical protein
MTDHLATPQRDGLAPSILAPRERVGVPVWLLVVLIVIAFGLGWALASVQLTGSGVPIALPGATPSATPEPEEVDTEDDSAFVRVATRDLDDFGDDLDDVDITLDEDGFWRLLTNAVELNFNVSQLQGHEAPDSIADDWASGLDQLADDVDAIEAGITAGSHSTVRSAVADARDTLEGLRGVVSRVD